MKLIIFSDIDGTLYSDDKQLLDATRNDIKAFQELGHEFVFATGNPYIENVPRLAKELNIRYCITSNGAAIFDTHKDKFIYIAPITHKKATQILNYSLEHKVGADWWDQQNIYFNQYTLEKALVEIRKSISKNGEKMLPSNSIINDILKIEFYDDPAKITKALPFLNQLELQVVQMQPFHVEITNKWVSKGNAIKWLLKKLEIPMNNVMAVGDSANDVSMFESVDHSYAMGNAGAAVKAKTLNATSHVKENGLGEAINHFLEIKKYK